MIYQLSNCVCPGSHSIPLSLSPGSFKYYKGNSSINNSEGVSIYDSETGGGGGTGKVDEVREASK